MSQKIILDVIDISTVAEKITVKKSTDGENRNIYVNQTMAGEVKREDGIAVRPGGTHNYEEYTASDGNVKRKVGPIVMQWIPNFFSGANIEGGEGEAGAWVAAGSGSFVQMYNHGHTGVDDGGWNAGPAEH